MNHFSEVMPQQSRLQFVSTQTTHRTGDRDVTGTSKWWVSTLILVAVGLSIGAALSWFRSSYSSDRTEYEVPASEDSGAPILPTEDSDLLIRD